MKISVSRNAVLALAAFAAPASAEVKSASPNHFEVERKIIAASTPDEAYRMLARVDEWWNKDHTYSGDSANLRLELQAGGCLCEPIPGGGGSVEHLRIVFARQGQLVRAQGGLGPLQSEAVAATMTWTLRTVEGGAEITQNYLVSGHIRGGTSPLAPAVDEMLGEQLSRLQKRLAS